MTAVTWLHLSDLHFKAGEEFERFNRQVVLEALWRDIATQIREGLRADFIVFTGDVAYSGKEEEYELAIKHFFDPLLEVSGLSKERLFVIPGNHDVDWDIVNKDLITPLGMRSLLENEDKITQFLSKGHDREPAFKKFRGYSNFVEAYFEGALPFSPEQYFYTHILQVKGSTIGILGLNSVWMSACFKDDRGKVLDKNYLVVGEKQISDALRATEKADIRIALLHHPLGWLNDKDRHNWENLLNGKCHFVLHGHWHEPKVERRNLMGNEVVHIPAGAIFSGRNSLNVYSITQVDLDTRKAEVYLRRYNNRGRRGAEWTADEQSVGEGSKGIYTCYFSEKGRSDEAALTKTTDYRVLLVEDGEEWRVLVEDILVEPSFKIEVAHSFKEARRFLMKPFDLILVNPCLKGDDDFEGIAVLQELKSLDVRTPCIVLTGSSMRVGGLFERFDVREIFVKGRGFNKGEFLEVVYQTIQESAGYQSAVY